MADYPLPGPGVWWSHSADGSVRFHDSIGNPETRPEGPRVAHFRNSSVAEEVKKVQACWKECLELTVELPIKKVRFEDSNGQHIDDDLLGSVDNAEEVATPSLPRSPRASVAQPHHHIEIKLESDFSSDGGESELPEINGNSAAPSKFGEGTCRHEHRYHKDSGRSKSRQAEDKRRRPGSRCSCRKERNGIPPGKTGEYTGSCLI